MNNQPLMIYTVTRQDSTWSLYIAEVDVDVEATAPFAPRELSHFASWSFRSSAVDTADNWSRKVNHCGLVAQIARKQKSGLNFEITCIGNHGCGIVSRQTTVAYGVEAYQAHIRKYHVPALIPIKESA